MSDSFQLGLACAVTTFLLWGTADYLAARLARRVGELRTLLGVQTAGAPVLLLAWAVIRPPWPTVSSLGWIALAAVSFFVGYLAFFHGLRVGAISLVSPISSGGALIPVAVGVTVMGEPLSGPRAFGIGLTLLGLVVALTDLRAVHDLDAARRQRGAWAGVATLLTWGSGTAFLLPAIAAAGWFAPIALIRGIIVLLIGGWAVFQLLRKTPGPRTSLWDASSRPLIVAAALLDLGAFFAYAIALTSIPASVAAPIASAYPIVTILLARRNLGETLTPREWTGVAVTMGGVTTLGLG